ncbi:MAG: glutathione S-transferase family protein [Alphaproteobacteria bacterium]|nr:glutathione S-transferase family protein [Alphaproteobacteria bacterium]MBV9419833.1 glutathione S-transferase family protein [Alphaproteobacteria bacterium]MBV9542512.1 glutathione S-transferase family protein [Alphaproteobacteria bacterium]MBV9904978.1 glutathione S-transferase family protein [Alphaproteobacteria bacterium]
MTIKLHVFPLSPRAFKVLFAAHQIGVPYEMVFVNFATGATQTPAYGELNPNRRMPVLEDGDYRLWESNAIVQYLAALRPESGYLPADLKERMTAIKWQFWESAHWDPAAAIFMFERVVKKLFNRGPADEGEIKRGNELMARLGPVLDGQLAKTRYVGSDRMTVADLSIASTLASAEDAQMPIGEYRHIQRWITEMKALPAWAKTVAMQKPPG